jgi:hypothetical protein
MPRKKSPSQTYVRGLLSEEQFLRVLAYYVLAARNMGTENVSRISLMTIIKNVKKKNPERQFRVEVVLDGEPQKL